jgi:HEAT repeat protein
MNLPCLRFGLTIIAAFVLFAGTASGDDAGNAGPEVRATVGALELIVRDKNLAVLDQAIEKIIFQKAETLAVPVLAAALQHADMDVRGLAGYALVRIEAKKEPGLILALSQALRGKETRVRAKAAYALGEIGVPARTALPELRAALQDREATVRVKAAEAIWKLDGQSQPVLPIIIAALRDDGPPARIMAAYVLSKMGPEAAPAVPDLSALLTTDSVASIRELAAVALGKIGPAAKGALPALAKAIAGDQEAAVRSEALTALIQIKPADNDAFAVLHGLLTEKNRNLRHTAVRNLTLFGPLARLAVPSLLQIAEHDGDKDIRASAVFALQQTGADSADVAAAYIHALKDSAPDVRERGAYALGHLGSKARGAGLPLAQTLGDADEKVRQAAVTALSVLGAEARTAVPLLVEMLKSPDVVQRRLGASVLGRNGSAARLAVQPLLASLSDPDMEVRMDAASALTSAGAQVQAPVGVLIEAIDHSNKEMSKVLRPWAALCVARIGPAGRKAVPALIKLLADDDAPTRVAASHALGQIGPGALAAVPALIDVLKDDDVIVRAAAGTALGNMGLEAVPMLGDALNHRDPHVRAGSIQALVTIAALHANGVEADTHLHDALPLLGAALGNKDAQVRAGAAKALGHLGLAARRAIPDLRDALHDEDAHVRLAAATALAAISVVLQIKQETQWLDALEQTAAVLDSARQAPDLTTREQAEWTASIALVHQAVHGLRAVERGQLFDRILHNAWVPWVAGALFYVVSLLALWTVLLWLHPRTLLRVNIILTPYVDLQFPAWLGGMKLSLRDLFLLGLFKHRNRVLDAWVDENLAAARENYRKNNIVKTHRIYVSIPLMLNDRLVTNPGARDLVETFARQRGALLIWGEGGAGKTSLACQLGHWAMANDRAERLAEHRMLPIVLDQDLVLHLAEGRPAGAALVEAIRGHVQALTGAAEPVANDLLEQLLRRRRLLVIVDHFSEMSEATRHAIRPGQTDFPVNALIVTSRKEEVLDNVPQSIVQPLRIEGNVLSSFLEGYLTARGKRSLFDDREFFEACSRLTYLMGKRTITPLLARLYADLLMSHKEGTLDAMPVSVPDLMLGYLNELNRDLPVKERLDDRDVHGYAAALAWKCLEPSHRLSLVGLKDAQQALGDAGRERLDYLENRLGIIRTVQHARDRVGFTLEPLAEYLAALYLLEKFGEEQSLWESFLKKEAILKQKHGAASRFVMVLRDCCEARGGDVVRGLLEDYLGRTPLTREAA